MNEKKLRIYLKKKFGAAPYNIEIDIWQEVEIKSDIISHICADIEKDFNITITLKEQKYINNTTKLLEIIKRKLHLVAWDG